MSWFFKRNTANLLNSETESRNKIYEKGTLKATEHEKYGNIAARFE
jgi:hypothetical protein